VTEVSASHRIAGRVGRRPTRWSVTGRLAMRASTLAQRLMTASAISRLG
jgi:hypothetical protein